MSPDISISSIVQLLFVWEFSGPVDLGFSALARPIWSSFCIERMPQYSNQLAEAHFLGLFLGLTPYFH